MANVITNRLHNGLCSPIAFAATTATDACNTDAKLLKQQLFESPCLYYNVGALGRNSVSPVYFAFSIGTENIGGIFQIGLQYCVETAACIIQFPL